MKIKRYKRVNRYLNFYRNNFGFRQPYQILVDGTFCFAALNNKVNIAHNLPKYLQSELKLLTTQCAIIETESFGAKLHGALVILKQYVLHKCGHEKNPISGAQCFLSMIGKSNEKHYVIATQDRDFQKELQTIPGVPVLYLHSRSPVLISPGQASLEKSQERIHERQDIRPTDKAIIDGLKTENNLQEKTKRKGPKGPNPLSCKKKKRKVQQNSITLGGVKKKRKKIRIPRHIKELLEGQNK